MSFEQFWKDYIDQPVPAWQGITRRQMWTEGVLEAHRETAKKAWYTAMGAAIKLQEDSRARD